MFDLLQPWAALNRLFTTDSLGKTLERYILEHNPKTSTDVERLTERWHRENSFGRFF